MTPAPLSPITVPEETRRAPGSTDPRRGPRLLLDPVLTATVLALGICSVLVLGWVTSEAVPGQPHYYSERQAIYLAIGLVGMVVLARIDYARLRRFKVALYVVLLLSILAVLGGGSSTNGSVRSISFPLFSFQGSELGKVLLILALAALVVDRARQLRERETTALVMLAALVPAMLVIAQPDLGSGLVYVTIALTVLFVAGVPWRHLASLLALGATALTLVLVVAPAAGVQVLSGYQVERLTAFLHPTDNPAKKAAYQASYQQLEAKIAIGAGGAPAPAPAPRRSRANSSPRTPPTSCSPRSASATASSARRSCSRCTRC